MIQRTVSDTHNQQISPFMPTASSGWRSYHVEIYLLMRLSLSTFLTYRECLLINSSLIFRLLVLFLRISEIDFLAPASF